MDVEEIDILDFDDNSGLDKLGDDKIDETPVIIDTINEKEFLPIGSIVLLKEASKNLMIVGYLSSRIDYPDKVYDYAGCLFPEGILSSDESLLFDEDDIQEVIAKGYQNEETEELNSKLKEIVNKN